MRGQKTNRRGGKVFRNYLAILSLFVAVTMIVNIAVLFFVRSHLSNELLDSQRMYINAQAAAMDEALYNIEQTLTTLQTSALVQRRTVSNYRQRVDYLENENAIFSLLSTLCFTSSMIDEIFIVWNGSDSISTANGMMNRETYYNNRFTGDFDEWSGLFSANYPRMTLRKIDSARKGIDTGLTGAAETGKSRLYLLQSLLNTGTGKGGAICVVLKQTFIDSIFSDSTFSSDHVIALFDGDQGVLVANRDEETARAIISQADLDNGALHQSKGLLSRKKSGILDVEFAIFTPYEQVLGTFDRVFVMAGVFYGIVLLFLMGYAYLMSHRMYRPFREILSTLGEKGMGERAGDETSYINDRIMELLNVNHSMRSTLESGSHMVLQAILYKTIMGSPSVDEYLKTADTYNLPIHQGNYEIAVVWMDLPTNQDEQFYARYHDDFALFIQECLEPWIVDALDTRPDEYTLVLCVKDEREQARLAKALEDIHAWLGQRFADSSIFIGVSEAMSNIHLLKKCYGQALAALRRRSVQSGTPILFYQDDAGAPSIPYLPDNMEEKLREYIGNASDALLPYVEEILEINYKNNVRYEAYLSVCAAINRFIIRMVQGRDVIAFADLIHINSADDQYTCARCREIVLSNARMALSAFSRADKASNAVIDQVLQYVEEHFSENINLDTVAQSLGYTPNYLSRYFKQKRGINFTDYLNSRRVVCARDELAKTDMTLNEIALRCGFGSANVLIRAYEKYEGTTPGKYRKSLKYKE